MDFDEGNSLIPENNGGIGVINERLYFPTLESFSKEYDAIKDKSEREMYSGISKFYNKDFQCLRPIVIMENEKEVYEKLLLRKEKFLNRHKLKDTGDNFFRTEEDYFDDLDDLEDIIGDDAFASFLNSSAEIQIGNEIYKYTDVGLFITKDYSKLESFLEVRNISDDLLIKTDDIVKSQILEEFPDNGKTVIDGDLSYYKMQYLDPCDQQSGLGEEGCYIPGGGGYSGNGGGSNTPQSYESYIASLQPCTPSSGFFGSVFGTNKICKDKYESKRRVKTKAFNYNYLIAYHIGVKVKHQYKGWTKVWGKEDTDAVGLIVESAIFKYDFTSVVGQVLSNLNQKKVFVSPRTISSSHKGLYELNVLNWTNWFGNNVTNYNFVHAPNYYPYPFPLFHDDLVIEVWGDNSIVDQAVNAGNDLITRQKLNKYAWENLYGLSKDFLKDIATGSYELPDNITTMSKHTVGEVWVHKRSRKIKYNTAKVDENYDWGIGISITLNESNGFKLSNADISPYKPQQPEAFGARVYGLVKHNGEWHGSLIDF